MATIKSFTDIFQSKKLAEILPLESADMYYIHNHYEFEDYDTTPAIFEKDDHFAAYPKDLRCWSLAALLDVLPKIVNTQTLFIEASAALWHIGYMDVYIARSENPVDACVDMIEKLHEQKLI